jgi:hypothetical protein
MKRKVFKFFSKFRTFPPEDEMRNMNSDKGRNEMRV